MRIPFANRISSRYLLTVLDLEHAAERVAVGEPLAEFGRARLASDGNDACSAVLRRPPCHGLPHCLADDGKVLSAHTHGAFDLRFVRNNNVPLRVTNLAHNARRKQRAAVRDCRNDARHLYRRRREKALSDAHVVRVA